MLPQKRCQFWLSYRSLVSACFAAKYLASSAHLSVHVFQARSLEAWQRWGRCIRGSMHRKAAH